MRIIPNTFHGLVFYSRAQDNYNAHKLSGEDTPSGLAKLAHGRQHKCPLGWGHCTCCERVASRDAAIPPRASSSIARALAPPRAARAMRARDSCIGCTELRGARDAWFFH